MDKKINNNKSGPATNKVGLHGGNDRLYTLTIDTLSLTLIPIEEGSIFNYSTLIKSYGDDIRNVYPIGEEYYITHSVKNDKSYNYSFNLYWYGEQVAEIHTNVRRGRKDFVKINFECRTFYQVGKGWYEHITDVARLLKLKMNNISVVHVAYDSYGPYQWLKEKYTSSHWMLGKGHSDIRYVPLTDALYTHSGTTMIVGSVSSGKRIACYPKSPEIEKNGKWYIKEFHERNGLNMNKQLDRVEARLTNAWLKNYEYSLEELISPEGLEKLFLAAVREVGFKDISTEVKNKNTDYKAKCEKVFLVSPDLLDGRVMKKVKKSKAGKKSKHVLRSTFKSLLYTYIISGNVQDLYYLRYFMGCEINWIISAEGSKHEGLISLQELNQDHYKELAQKYAKDYIREGNTLSKEVKERQERIVEELFSSKPAPVTFRKGSEQVKILSAYAAIYNPYLLAPPQ